MLRSEPRSAPAGLPCGGGRRTPPGARLALPGRCRLPRPSPGQERLGGGDAARPAGRPTLPEKRRATASHGNGPLRGSRPRLAGRGGARAAPSAAAPAARQAAYRRAAAAAAGPVARARPSAFPQGGGGGAAPEPSPGRPGCRRAPLPALCRAARWEAELPPPLLLAFPPPPAVRAGIGGEAAAPRAPC